MINCFCLDAAGRSIHFYGRLIRRDYGRYPSPQNDSLLNFVTRPAAQSEVHLGGASCQHP